MNEYTKSCVEFVDALVEMKSNRENDYDYFQWDNDGVIRMSDGNWMVRYHGQTRIVSSIFLIAEVMGEMGLC